MIITAPSDRKVDVGYAEFKKGLDIGTITSAEVHDGLFFKRQFINISLQSPEQSEQLQLNLSNPHWTPTNSESDGKYIFFS